MPSYYNPYSFYPASYMSPINNYQQPQSYAPAQNVKMMEWVEGEVGAKAFQMPQGLPPNQPIPLWDSTDTVIYLKSWNPMGVPNPLQKLKYELPNDNQNMLQSGDTDGDAKMHEKYVTKDDLEEMKQEIRQLIEQTRSQTAGGSRGGK